jgi:hypothetical protein
MFLKPFTVNLTKKKVYKYINRQTVDYNVPEEKHVNAILPILPQEILNLQAADDVIQLLIKTELYKMLPMQDKNFV